MHDSKTQRRIQQHKLLKGTRNVTNRDKHINEALKQIFANNLFKISHNTRKVCFKTGRFVSMSLKYKLMTNPYVI